MEWEHLIHSSPSTCKKQEHDEKIWFVCPPAALVFCQWKMAEDAVASAAKILLRRQRVHTGAPRPIDLVSVIAIPVYGRDKGNGSAETYVWGSGRRIC